MTHAYIIQKDVTCMFHTCITWHTYTHTIIHTHTYQPETQVASDVMARLTSMGFSKTAIERAVRTAGSDHLVDLESALGKHVMLLLTDDTSEGNDGMDV
jgi:hypothetical protein